jgi:hypothetical protein
MREEEYEMDDKIAHLILDELFSSLETLETQTAALVQFLKDRGASDELPTWSKPEKPGALNVARPG